MLAKRSKSIDFVNSFFRRSIEQHECGESHQHLVLLIQQANDTFIAYHIHSSITEKRRTYERFIVEKQQVSQLKHVGQTALSPQEIESLCEYHLGLPHFTQHLCNCYKWPQETLAMLINSPVKETRQSFNAIYVGFVSSYSTLNTCDQFLCIG